MEKMLILLCFVLCCCPLHGQDLPNPAANLQVLPEGSYVVAMDNTLQTNTDPTPSKRFFNLKAYGLIIYLLNNNVNIKRVIRAGKAKDGVDFGVSARMIKPLSDPNAAVLNFKAGPFVVPADEIFRKNVDKLIDSYNSNAGGVSGITNANYKVKVYKTTADVNVDVRFEYNGWRPKIAVLNDGRNAAIHSTFLSLAGVPAVNYTVASNMDLTTNCYTFASEPHNASPAPSVVANLSNFVMQGGNFLAQCDAVNTYEAGGHYLSTNGIVKKNSKIAAVSYPNADLNFAQFEGSFDINQGGSFTNWDLAAGSTFTGITYSVATNNSNGTSVSPYGAAAAKVNDRSAAGGMVFYLGNHDFPSITDYDNINGIRMYMNAALTPSFTTSQLQYVYSMACNASAMQVQAINGPAVAYPVSFYLYADVGATPGAYDGGDVYIGAATVNNSAETKSIYVSPPFNSNTDFVMKIAPSSGCFSVEYVQPASCKYMTLSTELKNFTVRQEAQQIALQWQMANETGLAGFYIQRFENGAWTNRAYLFAGSRRQNSSGMYMYKDAVDFTGGVQYRLAGVTTGGQIRYSESRQITVNAGAAPEYTVFPMPARDGSIHIQFSTKEEKEVTILDLNGNCLRRWKNNTDTQLKAVRLPSGVYVVKVQVNHVITHQKIVVF